VRRLEIAIRLVQTHHPLTFRWAGLALLLAALAACAPVRDGRYPRDGGGSRPTQGPGQTPGPYGERDLSEFPRNPEAISGPAVLNLLEQARAALAAGRAEQAVASLEVALDIEPRNPFVWQQLAGAHLQQRLPDQAEQQAQRSNSFARGNPFIEIGNWRMIAAARQARGDQAGAQQARERVTELQDRLDE